MTKTFEFPATFTDLLTQANSLELYNALIQQLVKDFRLANIVLNVDEKDMPKLVFDKLHDKIFKLIQSDFATYLNLLYIIDVSEDQIKKLNGADIIELSNAISFLILKREWQKVWFKKYY